ncbi:hypothetical protein COCNU_05G004430 [Cocos nucifera]|uniref:Uncharacterized protein n=1 Tax=Cocos nucifera TaxID=13894 RepID=A0A8K0I8Q4_COCNU|nr:hypothetical protein COCNU_05G004430 [Cocos nucifera]
MAHSEDLEFTPLAFRSELMERDLILIHSQFHIPPEFQLEVLKAKECVCSPPPDWIGIYKECFRTRLRANLPSCSFNIILLLKGILELMVGEKDLSPPKALGPKTLQKRKADTTSGRSTRARVKLLSTPPTSKIEELNPHDIENFHIVRALHDSNPLAPERSHETPILMSEVILSLSAPNISNFFLEEEQTKGTGASETAMDGVQFIEAIGTPRIASTDTSKAALGKAQVSKAAGTFRTMPARVELHASSLDDYDLACKVFFDFLYLADASKLLAEPLKMKRQKALDYFIRHQDSNWRPPCSKWSKTNYQRRLEKLLIKPMLLREKLRMLRQH